jgi:hypothetical protein
LGVGEGGATILRPPRDTVVEEDNDSEVRKGVLNDPDRDSLVGDSRGTSNSVVLLLLPKA